MYISIPNTFSRLRSHSNASSVESSGYVSPTWRRSSMSKIEVLSNTPQEKPSPHARVSSDSEMLSPEAATAMGFTPKLFPILPPQGAPSQEFLQSETDNLLQSLLRENKILRNENTYLKFEAQVREEELAKFRRDYYADKFSAAVRKHILGSTRKSCEAPNPRQKLDRPTRSEVRPTKKAKASVIQPTVVASSSEIAPTISLARSDDCLEAMTTSSGTSQAARYNNSTTKAQEGIKAHKPTDKVYHILADSGRSSTLGHGQRTIKTVSVTPMPTVAARTPGPTGRSIPRSISRAYATAPVYSSRGRHLAPLASEIFKGEVQESLSCSKRSPVKKLHSVLHEVGINRTRTSARASSYSANPFIEADTSAKSLERRKAIHVEHPLIESASHVQNRIPSDETINGSAYALESHLPPLTPRTSTTRSIENAEALSAEQAFLSLERICAGFSSGSLGSLESTSDPSSMLNPLVDVPSLFVVDTTAGAKKSLSVRSRTSGLESPSFSRLSVKTSTPLISRYRSSILSSPFRPAATSSPKTMSHPNVRTIRKYTSPLHHTKVTGAISTSPSPVKKPIRKYTSPLRITKKGEGQYFVRPPHVRV